MYATGRTEEGSSGEVTSEEGTVRRPTTPRIDRPRTAPRRVSARRPAPASAPRPTMRPHSGARRTAPDARRCPPGPRPAPGHVFVERMPGEPLPTPPHMAQRPRMSVDRPRESAIHSPGEYSAKSGRMQLAQHSWHASMADFEARPTRSHSPGECVAGSISGQAFRIQLANTRPSRPTETHGTVAARPAAARSAAARPAAARPASRQAPAGPVAAPAAWRRYHRGDGRRPSRRSPRAVPLAPGARADRHPRRRDLPRGPRARRQGDLGRLARLALRRGDGPRDGPADRLR